MDIGVNLIRKQVLSLKSRRIAFFGLMLYLLIVGVFLTILCYNSAVDFVSACNCERDVAGFRDVYKKLPAGQKDIFAYASNMKSKIILYTERLQKIDMVLSKYADITQLLQGFSAPLPSGSYIDNFNFNASGGTLDFDIVMPEGAASDTNTDELISSWKRNGSLGPYTKDINSVYTKRQKKNKGSVLISKFSCSIPRTGL